jgi:hypothetical protein
MEEFAVPSWVTVVDVSQFTHEIFGETEEATMIEIEARLKVFAGMNGFTTKRQHIRMGGPSKCVVIGRSYSCTFKGCTCSWHFWIVMQPSGLYSLGKHRLLHDHPLDMGKTRRYRATHGFSDDEEVHIWQAIAMSMRPKAIQQSLQLCCKRDVSSKDVYNYLQSRNHVDYWNDASEFVKRCHSMRNEKRLALFDLSVDEDGVLNKMFFCPTSGYEHAKRYGQMIAMDATYKTNRFRLPLVTIIGEDNEGRTKGLAYAFLTQEASSDYTWVMQCLKRCLGNCDPTFLITDGDKAMKRAVDDVFETTAHFRCLWHLNKSVRKNMRAILGIRFNDFFVHFKRIQAEGCAINAGRMLEELCKKYALNENTYWMKEIHSSFSSWCEGMLPQRFCGRLRTTSPNESHHKRLKTRLRSTTSLCECLDVILDLKEAEMSIDIRTRPCRYPFLRHLQVSSLCANILDTQVSESFDIQHVEEDGGCSFVVDTWGKAYKVSKITGECTCGMTQRKGLPCKHVISELLRAQSTSAIETFCSDYWKLTERTSLFVDEYVDDPAPTTGTEHCTVMAGSERLQEQNEFLALVHRFLSFEDANDFKHEETSLIRHIKQSIMTISDSRHDVCRESDKDVTISSPLHPRGRRGRGTSKRAKDPFEEGEKRKRRKKATRSKRCVEESRGELDARITVPIEVESTRPLERETTVQVRSARIPKKRTDFFGGENQWDTRG